MRYLLAVFTLLVVLSQPYPALAADGAGDAASLINCLSDRYSFDCQERLAAMGDKALDALAGALDSPDIYVRENALNTMYNIGPPVERVQDRVIAALDDPAEGVRTAARAVLAMLNTDKAREALARFEQDEAKRDKEREAAAAALLQRLYTRDELKAELPAEPDYKYPLTLKHYLEIPMESGLAYVVTVHSGKERPDRLAVYGCTDAGCSQLMEQYVEDESVSFFEKPVAFRYNGMQFLHIQEMMDGTGSFHRDGIYLLSGDGGMSSVRYVSPAEAYKDRLGTGEGVWKGEELSFNDGSLTFRFGIWGEKDANCCPSAGEVTGSFDIVPVDSVKPGAGSKAERLKMEPVDFKRGPVKD